MVKVQVKDRIEENRLISIHAVKDKKLQKYMDKMALRSENYMGCWFWGGTKSPTGYGRVYWKGKTLMAHRLSYLMGGFKIPKGKILDHICRNRSCVKPDHLMISTNILNVLSGVGITAQNKRKKKCKRGHSLNKTNLDSYALKHGMRRCRICRNQALKRYRLAKWEEEK